jgi:hypothetical protein
MLIEMTSGYPMDLVLDEEIYEGYDCRKESDSLGICH